MVSRETFLSPTETSHYAKKKIPKHLNYLFVCWTECIHSQERTTLQSWQQIPLFLFLFFSSTTLTVRKNVTDFVICPPEYMSRVTAHDIKLLELLSLLFYVMVAILANKNLFSLHRFFSAKFIKFHNTAVLMSSTRWHHNPSWPSLSILNQPFYLTIFFKAIEDYLCQKNMIVGCVSL